MTRRLPLALAALTALTLTVTVADLAPAAVDTVTERTAHTAPARSAVHAQSRSAARQVDAPVPTLSWTACGDGSGLQCADARVPLDYDDPTGPTMRLHMTRLKADPLAGQTKIGTLFVNPGGPGGPSSQVPGIFARLLGKQHPPPLRRRGDRPARHRRRADRALPDPGASAARLSRGPSR